MLKSVLFAFLAISLSSSANGERIMVPSNIDALSDEMVTFINELNTTWKAGKNFHEEYTTEQLKKLMGVHPSYWDHPEFHLPIKHAHDEDLMSVMGELPENFDARKQWPKCPSIKEVRDQGSCGSCWAFGAVEAISDRMCIASKGKFTLDISAEDLVSCCGFFHLPPCGFGCGGGWPSMAWTNWRMNGIVTGGLFNGTGCRPYTIPPCAHHQKGTPLPECTDVLSTPECTTQCQEKYKKSYEEDKSKAKEVYQLSDPEAIRAEIYKNGPVEASFIVYADFPNYKSGVYQQHSQEQLGGHAIKLIGWGTEKGVPYWLAVNSWNKYWGDKGFFKIRRGTNECGIEQDINAGIPEL